MNETGSAAAGWFHAEGDPPGTQRYWDGHAWIGEPQPVPAAPTPPPPSTFAPPPGPTAGTGAMPYGTGISYDAQPKKKSSVWKWVIGAFLVLVLLVGGCSVLVWRAVSGPIDAGNDFLAELQDGDIAGAWALSDSACFAGNGEETLQQTFGGLVSEEYRLTGSNVEFVNGDQRGTTSGTITFGGGDERDIELFMVESDGWRVCGFDIGPAGG